MYQDARLRKKCFFSVAMPGLAFLLLAFQWSWGISISSYVLDNDGITCTCDRGVMKVKICKEDIVRVAYSPTSTIPTRPLKIVTNTWATPPAFTRTEAGDVITLQTSRMKVKVAKTNANITYTDLSDAVILSEYGKTMTAATVEGVSTYTVRGEFNSPTDEGLYGLGQHMAGKFNYKGQNEVLDQDYGLKATAISVLVSTKGYGIFWDSYAKINFTGNISGNTRYALSSECGDVLDYYFFYGPELDMVIKNYRVATGHAPLFPKWAYGLIQSKDRYNSQNEIFSVRDGYRNNKIALDCIVQDWHYWDGAGQQGCYCFNTNYGNVKTTVTNLHSANIHTLISIWSQLEQGSPPFNNFNTKGWLWPSDGTTHFIDAYSSGAREEFWNLIHNAFFDPNVQGWDGWWLDNDEPFPYPNGFNRRTLTTAMGKGVLFYNSYTFPMTEMGYKNWRRDIPGKRCVILHRANFAGQQAHSCMQWNNDIDPSWAHLHLSVTSGLNSTACGIPYWCTDIGGYWGAQFNMNWSLPENRELFTRWLQYGAFQPVYRIHGNGPSKELYQTCWDAATKTNLNLTNRLHYRLMPYIYSMAWMTTSQGYTPMRMLPFDFRTDPNVKNVDKQYMYGPAFMVSPVSTLNQRSRPVYLPAGKWYDFWTGATVNGGATITADAPLSQIPLHMRAGSIVPMGPEIQYATERADTIELRIYTGANGSFTIYEDEGDNYNYETGKYRTIPITYTDNPRSVTVGAGNGSYTGMDTKKIFNVVYVAENHGVGVGKTATPDQQIIWDGTTSIVRTPHSIASMAPAEYSARTIRNTIAFPEDFSGKTKEIAVYDCSGRLRHTASVEKNAIDVHKDFRLPAGAYIVKARIIR